MRIVRTTIAAIVFAALTIITAQAQAPRPAAPPAGGTTPATQPAAGPLRIAVIDSGDFSDEKAGIQRVITAVKQVDAQFEPRRNELKGMQDRYNALLADIQKKQAVQDPKVTAQQQDQADQLKVQIQRKAEDAQAAYQKRMGDVLEPLQQDVFNALQSFAQAHGISLIIDLNRNPSPVLDAADSVDIPREFIAEYNRTHPAAAAAAAPGRP